MVGMVMSMRTLGTIMGMMPNMAYLATHTATWASGGIHGNGMPEKSM